MNILLSQFALGGELDRPRRSGIPLRGERNTFIQRFVSKTVRFYLDSSSAQIASIEERMRELIDNDDDLSKNSAIVQSIPGIGPVTATELIIKTDNFKRVRTAKKCATLAGISPFPNSTGKTDKGAHVSNMGDRQLKSLLFMCARSAVVHFEKMRVYKMKKYDVEHKHIFVVLNNVANRLLKILYSLVKKGDMYDPRYLPRDPRLKTTN